MQHWTKVKEETKPGNIQGMIDDMLKNKRNSDANGTDMKKEAEDAAERSKKLQRRRERKHGKQEKLEKEAKDSYLNVEQSEFIQMKINHANRALKD